MMKEPQVFPAISINQFADPETFVYSWVRMFHHDKKYDKYVMLRFKEEWTEGDLLTLYEWFEGGKLSGDKLKAFTEEYIPKLCMSNVMKGEAGVGEIYAEFGYHEYLWPNFMATLLIDYPLFNRHTYRAFQYINTAEIKELPKEETELCSAYLAYLDFFDGFTALNPHCSTQDTEIALCVFGKFLKKQEALFFL